MGVTDAEILAKQFGGNLDVQGLMTLPRYHAYVRLLVSGEPTPPFSMQTLPFKAATKRRTDTIRRTSRHRYANPVASVEKQIREAFAPA